MDWTIFFGPFYRGGGSTPLVLREGWDAVYISTKGGREAECYYAGRVERRTLLRREG